MRAIIWSDVLFVNTGSCEHLCALNCISASMSAAAIVTLFYKHTAVFVWKIMYVYMCVTEGVYLRVMHRWTAWLRMSQSCMLTTDTNTLNPVCSCVYISKRHTAVTVCLYALVQACKCVFLCNSMIVHIYHIFVSINRTVEKLQALWLFKFFSITEYHWEGIWFVQNTACICLPNIQPERYL